MEFEFSLGEYVEFDGEYLILPDDDDEFDGYVLPADDERVEQDFDGYFLPDDDDELDGYVLPADDERVEQDFDGYFLPDDDEDEFEEEFNDYVLQSLQQLEEYNFEEPAAAAASSSAAAADRLKNVVIEPTERCKTCTICLEELEVGGEAASIKCSHKFHRECLLPWLATKTTCPCCRFQLL